MTNRAPIMQLTWAGFEAAVDVIAAQCRPRDRAGVHGADAAGQLLAYALSERLGLNALPQAGPGTIEIHGLAIKPSPSTWAWPDVEVWAWVDATEAQSVQSVMKVTAGTTVLMPWQDASASQRRTFVARFDD
jgi:hypothetical protein